MPSWQDASWLQPTWHQLFDARSRGAHALALDALPGLGAEELIQAYIARVLCESLAPLDPSGLACGHCPSCNWLASGQHPDLRILRPEALSQGTEAEGEGAEAQKPDRRLSKEIRIEQIRSMEAFLQLGSHRTGARIVWVEPAHLLNRYAANAMLKMLEEPGTGAFWILQTPQFSSLLPTIRSRCIRLRVEPPSQTEARVFLKKLLAVPRVSPMHRKGPNAASSHADHPVSVADHADEPDLDLALGLSAHAPWAAAQLLNEAGFKEQASWLKMLAHLPKGWFSDLAMRWTDHAPEQWFAVLERWATDLLLTLYHIEPFYFKDFQAEAQQRTRGKHPEQCFRLIDQLAKMKSSLRHPLNARLHAESALIAYAGFVSEAGTVSLQRS